MTLTPRPLPQDLSDEQVEKLLRGLPSFTISARADARFYEALQAKGLPVSTKKNRWTWLSLGKFAALSSMTLVIVAVGGTTLAYSDTVTRGSALYAWKQTGEKIELSFSNGPESEADVHVRFSDRRMHEAENIVAHNPMLGSFVTATFAQDADLDGASDTTDETPVGLETPESVNLAATLNDMEDEVQKATKIVEENEMEPSTADRVLARVEEASDRHARVMARLEERSTNKKIITLINNAGWKQENHIALVVEARQDVQEAIKRKDRKIMVRLSSPFFVDQVIQSGNVTQGFESAAAAINTLPQIERGDFEKKLKVAQDAYNAGRVGVALGLTRSLEKKIVRVPVAAENAFGAEAILDVTGSQNAASREKKVNKVELPTAISLPTLVKEKEREKSKQVPFFKNPTTDHNKGKFIPLAPIPSTITNPVNSQRPHSDPTRTKTTQILIPSQVKLRPIVPLSRLRSISSPTITIQKPPIVLPKLPTTIPKFPVPLR